MNEFLKKSCIFTCTAAIASATAAAIQMDDSVFQTPKCEPAPYEFSFPVPEHIKPIMYEAGSYQGKPVKAFAWLGIPPEAKGKIPGMVLVHGGGGTAFLRWVKYWNDRGYAAIAMDTVGHRPLREWEHLIDVRESTGLGGPSQSDYQNDQYQISDAWCIQALNAIIAAHSLLRSHPQVDAGNIGITGISRGGYLTCLAAGTDHRFKAAAPVYGCGYIGSCKFFGSIPEEWSMIFDASVFLPAVQIPFCFISRPDDVYEFIPLVKSTRLVKHAKVSLPGCFGHSHECGLRDEVVHFMDTMLKNQPPIPEIGLLSRTGNTVSANFSADLPIDRGTLFYTLDRDLTDQRNWKWETLPARIDGATVSAELPPETAYYYLNITDSRGMTVSSLPGELDL